MRAGTPPEPGKKQYRPQLRNAEQLSDVIQHEIKGADVRKNLRAGNHGWRRAAMEFVSSLLDILEAHEARVPARVWVKEVREAFNESGVYPGFRGRAERVLPGSVGP